MGCFTAETGTMIFAILSMIVTIVACLVDLGLLGYLAVYYQNNYGDYPAIIRPDPSPQMVLGLAGLLIELGFSLIYLIFVSFLLHGVIKKNPRYVKAYFIFGVFLEVVGGIAFIGTCVSGNLVRSEDIFGVVSIFGVYTLIMWMIYRTYRQFEERSISYGRMSLIDNENPK